MKVANLKQAQANLEKLIQLALNGEEIFIARRTTIVAQLLPLNPIASGARAVGKRRFGAMKDKMKPDPKRKKS